MPMHRTRFERGQKIKVTNVIDDRGTCVVELASLYQPTDRNLVFSDLGAGSSQLSDIVLTLIQRLFVALIAVY